MSFNIIKMIANKAAFYVDTDLNSIGSTSEHDYLLLNNPSDSGKRFFVTHLNNGTDSATVRSIFRFYIRPVVTTDGTALSIVNTYCDATPVASEMEAFKDPTISSRGDRINTSLFPANSPNRGSNRFTWVDPGCSVLLTVQNTVVGASSLSALYWMEE